MKDVALSIRHAGILKFFPPPRFLEMPAVGLDISDESLRCLYFGKHQGSVSLDFYKESLLPQGTIAEGYVNNPKEVTDVLRAMSKDFPTKFVRAALPDEKAFLFKVQIPRVPQGAIRQSVESVLEENVPISAADAVFDCALIHSSRESEDHLDIGVAVLPSKVVSTYEEIIKAADLEPVSFTVKAQAIANSVIPRDEKRPYLIVNFEARKTGLYIASGGIVHFASTLDIGGNAITSAIEKHFSVSTLEAERIKQEKGFIKDRKNMDLFFSLVNTVSALKDEISKLTIYWYTHKDKYGNIGEKIHKIILCGRDAGLAGFDEYLALTMKSSVEVANPWRNVFDFDTYIPPLQFLESLNYAAAAGCVLPEI